ncbi:putative nadh-ubiquinone oxidoreductase kda subunit protein [Phaeoacremonium minimum UCRPA7]|uniref:Putative nadh-ubiquinone oxidoreductase kDa subunit protein n=1 Tax=Phaeoacremonium minimum (strain UCR-PA7) TaxID=1286976 RepID=R8BS35_PHAM7|nr:putative nadh-ubiquinone oxidoreductase kda subunit protein [Phaeoacremonium minimum UCRPA7]EOO02177.1 putative nadh-ubiquinone oxidoreductase kda subunit protein [Phaeoacremonium minimum UCRPA7]
MPKRKRSIEDELEERLAKWRKDLFRVLKVAKGFERQRLAKRIRDDKSTPDKISRLEREVVVLKSLDLQQTANTHLCSALLRIKAVAESPKLPEDVKTGVSKPDISEEERTALHNVTSALYNRSQVKEVLDQAVADICAILRVPPPDKKSKGKKGEKKTSTDSRLKEDKAVEKSLPKKQVEREGSWSGEEEDEFEGFDDEIDGADIEDGEQSDSDAQEFSNEEASGDISSGKEEEAVDRWEAMLGSGSSDSDEEDDAEDDDDKSAASDDASASASPPRKVARAKASKNTKPTGADSLFLPSLMGGYISGSESASDVDVAPPARKNRRGQRARQALSELKYKDKAKHLEKAKKGRDAGWDNKRGAVGSDNGRPWKNGIHNPLDRAANNGGDAAFDRPKRTAPPPKKDNEGPLHPSWEAKKKAKEMQKTATFQGKKISFD